MLEKSICIVMSTYNGEKYLEEQLDSLFKQTYPNIKIFVRDDGSKDNTVKILKKYAMSDRIKFFNGKNIGFVNSFISILKEADGFDYYAFCDQDDVWLPNKIEIAVNKINNLDYEGPLMYFCNQDICDQNLNHISYNEKPKIISFPNSCFENIASGNVMVINDQLRKIFLDGSLKKITFHDRALYMIASSIGKVYYDEEPLIKYRKHDKNVTCYINGFYNYQLYRIKQLIVKRKLKDNKTQTREMLCEFEHVYGKLLSVENKKMLSMFTKHKNNFYNNLKKAFYVHRYRQKFLDEILIRVLFIIGYI